MGTPRFTPEFKEEAVRQITERGYSVAEVSDRRPPPRGQMRCHAPGPKANGLLPAHLTSTLRKSGLAVIRKEVNCCNRKKRSPSGAGYDYFRRQFSRHSPCSPSSTSGHTTASGNAVSHSPGSQPLSFPLHPLFQPRPATPYHP